MGQEGWFRVVLQSEVYRIGSIIAMARRGHVQRSRLDRHLVLASSPVDTLMRRSLGLFINAVFTRSKQQEPMATCR